MKPKKKPALVQMLVTVPRLPELTLADQRRSVRFTLQQTGDYYGRAVRVGPVPAGVAVAPDTLANTHPVAPDGELAKAREQATRLTLNARQLHQAWQLANPDPGDQDQEETEITIRWWAGGKDTDGDDAPEGYYAHLAEYPEEGALFLDPDRHIDGVSGPVGQTFSPTDAHGSEP